MKNWEPRGTHREYTVNDAGAALDRLGISYKVSGNEAVARCPSHNDRHPSWSINLVTGLHHCFSCGFGGQFSRVVEAVLKLSPSQAAVWCDTAGLLKQGLTAPRPKVEDNSWRFTEAMMHYYDSPPEHKLRERNITSEACAELGIRWDNAHGTWILPIRDPWSGKLWGWQSKDDRYGTVRNHPDDVPKSRTLFGMGAFEHGSTAILVESPLDVARLLAAGIRGGLSSYGVQISADQLSVVVNSAGGVVAAFDNDLAGLTVSERLRRGAIPVKFWDYSVAPGAKDPGDMSDDQLHAALAGATSQVTTRFDLKEGCTLVYR
jgi:DNA primase